MQESNTKMIVEALAAGDTRALKDLYQEYGGLFFSIAKRYASSTQEAEDWTQEAFVQIYRKAGDFKFNGSFEGWMKRVVVNICLSALRKKKLEFDDSQDSSTLLNHPSSYANVLDEMSASDIIKAIALLPSGCRMVLNLHAIEGMSHTEISNELGITESASRSQLTKARGRLKEILLQKELIEK